jgi:hypothetical protein
MLNKFLPLSITFCSWLVFEFSFADHENLEDT